MVVVVAAARAGDELETKSSPLDPVLIYMMDYYRLVSDITRPWPCFTLYIAFYLPVLL